MTIEVPAGLRSWFFISSLILSLDLGVTLCFFDTNGLVMIRCFLFWGISFFLLCFFLIIFFSTSTAGHLFSSSLLNILHLASVSHGLDLFILFYFLCLLSCVCEYPSHSPCVSPSVSHRVYSVSIVPSVHFEIWCWCDTRGNGVRVVFISTFR